MNARRPALVAALALFTLLGVAACGGAAKPAPEPAAPAASAPPASGPPHRTLTAEDCAAKGGEVVGDPGNGSTHKPEFRCPSGSPPIGEVPVGIEGSVCCT